MINLKEAGQHQELGDGSLYTKLQGKMQESMLARYHRWVFEYNKEESGLALREWIMQESGFQIIATETVCVFSGKFTNAPLRTVPKYGNEQTFFWRSKKWSYISEDTLSGLWNVSWNMELSGFHSKKRSREMEHC